MRPAAVLTILGAVLVVGGCETSSWSTSCSTTPDGRTCEIDMSGTRFHELPFPVSGPVMDSSPDRFRLEEATTGGAATFSAGGTEGGTFSCTTGETVQVADATITCDEIGDQSLRFTISRQR